MTTISWINPFGGDWATKANWSTNTVPGSGDDVLITIGGFDTVVADTDAVHSVTLDNPTVTLELPINTMAVAGLVLVANGILSVDRGTLQGGTVEVTGGTAVVTGGALNGVTWQGPLNIDSANANLFVVGGLTLQQPGGALPGTLSLTGNNSRLTFQDAEVLDNVTFNFGTAGASTEIDTFTTLSEQVSFGFGSGAVVNVAGSNNLIFGTTLTNAGTIAIGGGASLAFQAFSNANNSFINTGSISIGANGSLILDGGTVLLSSLGNISNAGGTLAIGGALDIEGGTLTIGNGTAFQNIDNRGGELRNGTVVYQSGSPTLENLNHITWEGPMNLDGDYVSVAIRNGFTILGSDGVSPGVINFTGITGQMLFADTETLSALTLNLTPANPAAIAIADIWGTNTTFDATTTINVAMDPGNAAGFDTVTQPG
jgi:hypothetical protein